jgi:hypothetical protein
MPSSIATVFHGRWNFPFAGKMEQQMMGQPAVDPIESRTRLTKNAKGHSPRPNLTDYAAECSRFKWSSELTDPTVTITSLGERGADSVIGVIYPPQVAIVGFGRIAERPWVADGKIRTRPLVTVSLSADHRASDGHTGGKLLSTIDDLLQEPGSL